MLNLPTIVIDWIDPFAPCFYGVTTWMKAQLLGIGAILTPGKRIEIETSLENCQRKSMTIHA